MNRFDRALAILLLLRSGKTWSAPNLACRLEVSTRTIYRDIETLSAVGVPVYAEAGPEGGYRLVEGYFLPPIAFTVGEATSLLTGLALLDRLHQSASGCVPAGAQRRLRRDQTPANLAFEPVPACLGRPPGIAGADAGIWSATLLPQLGVGPLGDNS
jgi:predicted DNA-binding transcriptional regulator YafY